jgi:WD40 repeat protein
MAIAVGGMACSPEERSFPTSSATGTGGAGGAGGTGGTGGGLACMPGASEACYTGPEGSNGTGNCKAGTHVCNEDGTGFGACEGEVLPKAEDCTTAEDEACNGADAMECAPLGYVWSKVYGAGFGAQVVYDIAVTPDGDLVVVGGFAGTIDFGGQLMASTGSSDIFVAKLKANGDHVWSKRFGDASSQRAFTVAVDSTGAIYVGGNVSGSVDFGDAKILMSKGGDDAFVAKFNPDGDLVWAKLFGDTASEGVKKIRVTKANQLIVAGAFTGALSLGGPTLTSAGAADIFVAKLSSDGFHSTSRRYGGTGFDGLNGLAIDSTDAVILTGGFDTTIDLIPGAPLTSAGSRDVFVAKLSSSTLSTVWARRWGDADYQEGHDVAVTLGDEVALSGSFKSAIDFGVNTLKTADAAAENLYVARLTPAGDVVGATSFGDASTNVDMTRLAYDAKNDHFVMAGDFTGSMEFGGGPLVGTLGDDPFLVKLTNAGKHVAAKSFLSEKGPVFDNNNTILALTLLPSGDLVVGGNLMSPVDFGGGAIGNASDPKEGGDAFLARFLH